MSVHRINGFDIFVDDVDDHFLVNRTWTIMKKQHTYYARCGSYIDGKRPFLHKVICKGNIVDHIDGNGLNCRRSNLRDATSSQNNMNRRSMTDNAKGVSYFKHSKLWMARITVDGKSESKSFRTYEEAVECRKQMEIVHFGEFAGNGTGGSHHH